MAEATMASSTPTTPVPRRSASLPTPRLPSSPDPQIEVLFTLPSARIIDFQTSGSTSISRRGSLSGDGHVAEEESGTLQWVSRFERTIAVGMDSHHSYSVRDLHASCDYSFDEMDLAVLSPRTSCRSARSDGSRLNRSNLLND